VKSLIKTISIIVLFVTLTNSCRLENNTPVDHENETNIALRIVLNNLKELYHIKNVQQTRDSLCFDFSYPIHLFFNNQSSAKVDNFDGLLDILYSETSELYIESIETPFNVLVKQKEQTIISEVDFFNLLYDCAVVMPVQSDFLASCFSITYPIQVVTIDGQNHEIISQTAFEDFLHEYFNIWYFEFVYPINITLEDASQVSINNAYDLFNVLDDCFNCGCPDNYNPVCVNIDNEIIEFFNSCDAECAGFYDYTECENSQNIIVNNISIVAGDCNSDNKTYPITIDFIHKNINTDFFFIQDANGDVLRQTFLFSDLPITIPDYSGEGFLSILIPDNAFPHNNMFTLGTDFVAPTCL
jgi:hypothetical protein